MKRSSRFQLIWDGSLGRGGGRKRTHKSFTETASQKGAPRNGAETGLRDGQGGLAAPSALSLGSMVGLHIDPLHSPTASLLLVSASVRTHMVASSIPCGAIEFVPSLVSSSLTAQTPSCLPLCRGNQYQGGEIHRLACRHTCPSDCTKHFTSLQQPSQRRISYKRDIQAMYR